MFSAPHAEDFTGTCYSTYAIPDEAMYQALCDGCSLRPSGVEACSPFFTMRASVNPAQGCGVYTVIRAANKVRSPPTKEHPVQGWVAVSTDVSSLPRFSRFSAVVHTCRKLAGRLVLDAYSYRFARAHFKPHFVARELDVSDLHGSVGDE